MTTFATRLRPALAGLGVLILFAAVSAVPAVGAVPATPALAGLGDSYASGLGTGHYYGRSGDCRRSPDAYPVLVSGRIGASLRFVACADATTVDVDADQLGVLSAATTDVTLTVGGNDVGFVAVLSECALPSWAADCFGAITAARWLARNVLPTELDLLYADISAAAPHAHVAIAGYPRLFNGHDCSALTDFTANEMTQLNASADLLDQILSQRAAAHGFAYADPRAAFVGHAVCDRAAWINNLSYPVGESFHPTVAGQQALATVVAGRV